MSKPHPTKPPPEKEAQSLSAKEGEQGKGEKENPIEIAKHDIEDAAAHGILKPPPPGAGMVRRLFHQAKELFVRYSLLPSLLLV